jgi:pilus assembly protein CpaB
MRAIFGLVLVVGMGLAGFAVYMVKGHFAAQEAMIQQQAAKAQAIIPTVDIYAVNRSIAYGEFLTLEDVQPIKHTEEFLPEGTFASQEELFPQGVDVPRVVLRAMEPNEPVTTLKVTAPGEAASITTRLTEGMRAFSINVDQTSGVSGVRPGDRVDVLWTGNLPGLENDGTEVTRLIETGLEVIAVDQSSDVNRAAGEIARQVTVQVSPQDVADLTQANTSGKLTLSLLGRGDQTVAIVSQTDTYSITGTERAVAPAPTAAPVVEEICYRIERKGVETIQIPTACTN